MQGVYALQELYERNGYFHARVRVAVETDPVHHARRGHLPRQQRPARHRGHHRVRPPRGSLPGGRAGPAAPPPAGQAVQPPRRRTRTPSGSRTGSSASQYGQARVDAPREEYEPEGNTVELTYPIAVGPKISLVVKGADEKKLRRKGLLPFFGELRLRRGPGAPGPEPDQDLLPAAGALRRPGRDRRAAEGRPARAHPPDHPRPGLYARPGRPQGKRGGSGRRAAQGHDHRRPRPAAAPAAAGWCSRSSTPTSTTSGATTPSPATTRRWWGPPRWSAGSRTSSVVIPIQEGPRERVVRINFQGVAALDSGALRKPAAPGRGEAVPPGPPRQPRWMRSGAAYAEPGLQPRPRSRPGRTGTRSTPWSTSSSRCSKAPARWWTASSCVATSGRRGT